MKEYWLRIYSKILPYIKNLLPKKINKIDLFWIVGWFLSAYIIIYTLPGIPAFSVLLLIVFGYFFRKTHTVFSTRFKISTEMLLLLFLMFYLIELGFLALTSTTISPNFQSYPNIFLTFLQTVISWYFLPKFLSTLFKLYILAILIKIPFVLVYHHASLSRKIRIAGWLQSSIPQFIQLILLLFFFYFFLAGWQAENLKNSIQNQLTRIQEGLYPAKQDVLTYTKTDSRKELKIPGHDSIILDNQVLDQGVFAVKSLAGTDTNPSTYYLYFKSDSIADKIFLVKLDSLFLNSLKKDLALIAASHLAAYPFHKTGWDSIFYNIRFWQNKNYYNDIKIFPFSLIPNKSKQMLMVRLEKTEESGPRIKIVQQDMFTAGRVYLPLYAENFERKGYYAFDVIIMTSFSFFSSNLMKQILFWFIIYLLINFLIIRRVIKFGNAINQIILQKFDRLKHGIRQISGGNLDYKIHLEGEDEFVEFAQRFNQMGVELKKKIAEVREKERFEYELKIARDVQLSLLPAELPVIPGYEIAGAMQTANEVGGDFYDAIPIAPNKYLFVVGDVSGFVVGDVSGKSTSAAFYMAQCISLIRFARQFTTRPRDILLRLNKYFSQTITDKQIFVTVIIGLLDTEQNSVEIFRAGHNNPLFFSSLKDQEVEEIKILGLGIGLEREGKQFEKHLKHKLIRMKLGDVLFLYSDGVIEAARTKKSDPNQREFFGEKRLF
ncbi:MAG: SpoIIE family protein phosphatase [Calditrichia bacterium]